MAEDQGILGRERMELVGVSLEGLARQASQLLGNEQVEALGCVEARSHGGAAKGQAAEQRQAGLQGLNARLQHAAPA